MVAGAKLRGGELAVVGGSGAIEGHSGFCLVQKNVYARRNPLEGTGWLFCARPWLAVARGGPGRRRAAFPRSRSRSGSGLATGNDIEAWVIYSRA